MKSNQLSIKGIAMLLLVLFSAQFLMSQTSCPGFKTYTQGGWGSTPNGNNAGTFLDANFAANFPAPAYLTIGCTNKLQLTSAAAVRAFLPNGTTPAVLPAGTLVNRTKNNFSNVLAGQLVALTLNMRFDNNIPSFGASSTNLKDLVIASGPFRGKTVQFLADNANMIIGGCPGFFPKTLSEYTTAIDNVNKNYDNGTNTQSFLACPMVLSSNLTHVLCKGAATGSASILISGGRAPYSYVWTNNAGNVASSTNLTAGSYSVTVSDASGQIKTISFVITEPATVLTASDSHIDIRCFNESNGSLNVQFSGGTAPYAVSFNGGGFISSVSPANYGNLATGTYSWMVRDANGCLVSDSEILNQPQVLTINAALSESVRCFNECNGALSATSEGGNGGNTFTWSNGNTGANISNVCAGNYSVSVTDARGCVAASEIVNVIQPEELIASASVEGLIVCHDECSGSLSASATGGNGNYLFTWNDAATDEIRTSVCAGNYSVRVTDMKGCTATSNEVALENPESLIVSFESTDCSNCFGDACDGSVNLAISGGVSPYTLAWSVDGNTSELNNQLSMGDLCAGSIITISVKDDLGCSTFNSIETAIIVEIGCRQSQECLPLKTFTQGGWGATPNGNNPGVYLHANFDAAFPNGVTIGCGNTLSFTSADAITSWLPSGSTPAYLPEGSIINPSNYRNVLAAQLLAATLNVGFDAYDAEFGSGENQLANMYITSGTYAGMTVNELLQAANNAIGGCDFETSLPELNAALTAFNENYDNGTIDLGFLSCINPSSGARFAYSNTSENENQLLVISEIYPNPAIGEAKMTIVGEEGQIANVKMFDLTGRMLQNFNQALTQGANTLNLSFNNIETQQCIIVVCAGNKVITRSVSVQH